MQQYITREYRKITRPFPPTVRPPWRLLRVSGSHLPAVVPSARHASPASRAAAKAQGLVQARSEPSPWWTPTLSIALIATIAVL